MHIQSFKQEPSFGISYYPSKQNWSKNVLKAFEESKLYSDLSAKYPNAYGEYGHFNYVDIFGNSLEYVSYLKIGLDKGKNNRIIIKKRSPYKKTADELLSDCVKNLLPSDIEDKVSIPKANIVDTEKRTTNTIIKVLKNIFMGIKYKM